MSEPTKAAMRTAEAIKTLEPDICATHVAEFIDGELKLHQLLSAVSRILQCDYDCPEEGESLDECLDFLRDAYSDTMYSPDNDAEAAS